MSLRTHRTVPRKLPDGPISLYPVFVTGEARIINGKQVREVIIDQMAWSMLLDVIVRQDAARQRRQSA